HRVPLVFFVMHGVCASPSVGMQRPRPRPTSPSQLPHSPTFLPFPTAKRMPPLSQFCLVLYFFITLFVRPDLSFRRSHWIVLCLPPATNLGTATFSAGRIPSLSFVMRRATVPGRRRRARRCPCSGR